MQRRRNLEEIRDLTRGPARLCQALDITKSFDSHDLTLGHQLWIAEGPNANGDTPRVHRSRRIGVTSAHGRLLRFVLANNSYVSGSRVIRSKAS